MPQPLKVTLAIMLVIGGVVFAAYRYKQATTIPVAPRRALFETAQASASASAPASGAPQAASAPAAQQIAANPVLAGLQPLGPEERAKVREEMLGQLNLTPDQRSKLDAIEKKYEGKSDREVWMERMKAGSAVLTPEQRQKAGDFIQNQFRQRLMNSLSVLPSAEREKFMKKMEESMGEWRKRIETEIGQGAGSQTNSESQ